MVEKISEFRRQMEDGSVLVCIPKKAESATKDSEGQTITMTYATKAQLADGSVTKVGVNTVGANNKPIYLNNGVPTVCTNVVDLDTKQTLQNKTLGRLIQSGTIEEEVALQNTSIPKLKFGEGTNLGHRITFYTAGTLDADERLGVIRTYNRTSGHNSMYLTINRRNAGGFLTGASLTLHTGEPTHGDYLTAPIPANSAPDDTVAVKKTVTDMASSIADTKLAGYSEMVRINSENRLTQINRFDKRIYGFVSGVVLGGTPNTNDSTHWVNVCWWEANNSSLEFDIYGSLNNATVSRSKIVAGKFSNASIFSAVYRMATVTGAKLTACMTVKGKRCELWIKSFPYHPYIVVQNESFGYAAMVEVRATPYGNYELKDKPTPADYDAVIDLTEMV